MNKVNISVIIPVYNAELYLEKTLECIVNQTMKEIEIICVDDGSTDKSIDIIQSFQERDSRIKLFYQTEPSDNAALARNLGIRHAVGEYLYFADADDLFEKELLQEAFDKIEDEDADIVVFDAFHYYNETMTDIFTDTVCRGFNSVGEEIDKNRFSNTLFQLCSGIVWNKLFRKELIINNQIWFKSIFGADDLEFSYLACACADKIVTIKKRFVHYRKDNNGESQTKAYFRNEENVLASLLSVKDALEAKTLFDKYKVTYANVLLAHINYFMRGIEDFERCKKLYNEFCKEEIRKRYGLLEVSENEISAERSKCLLKCLSNETFERYLFMIARIKPSFSANLKLPYGWKKNVNYKVILYGAGNIGRSVFGKIREESYFTLMHWVDRDFDKYGGGIESPEIIKKEVYDLIYVAVERKDLYDQISEALIMDGVAPDKIMWTGK